MFCKFLFKPFSTVVHYSGPPSVDTCFFRFAINIRKSDEDNEYLYTNEPVASSLHSQSTTQERSCKTKKSHKNLTAPCPPAPCSIWLPPLTPLSSSLPPLLLGTRLKFLSLEPATSPAQGENRAIAHSNQACAWIVPGQVKLKDGSQNIRAEVETRSYMTYSTCTFPLCDNLNPTTRRLLYFIYKSSTNASYVFSLSSTICERSTIPTGKTTQWHLPLCVKLKLACWLVWTCRLLLCCPGGDQY